MFCPVCGHPTKVSKSKKRRLGNVVKRWRDCPLCKKKLKTTERIDTDAFINLSKLTGSK